MYAKLPNFLVGSRAQAGPQLHNLHWYWSLLSALLRIQTSTSRCGQAWLSDKRTTPHEKCRPTRARQVTYGTLPLRGSLSLPCAADPAAKQESASAVRYTSRKNVGSAGEAIWLRVAVKGTGHSRIVLPHCTPPFCCVFL